jgi:hypothetical protein
VSTLKTITDALKTQLVTITDVELVTDDIARWNARHEDEYNCLFLSPRIIESRWISFPHTTGDDKEYTAEITINGTVTARYPSDIDSDLDTCAGSVEDEMYNNTSIGALVDDVTLTRRDTDSNLDEAYGIFELVFEVTYSANHNSP